MSSKTLVGEQLDSQILYERQKQLREAQAFLSGPTIVASGLQVPENMGSVLRLADAVGSPRVIFVNQMPELSVLAQTDASLARLRRTARHTDALVKWEICTQEKFVHDLAPTLQPLIAVELTTHSTNLFETRLPDLCTLLIGSERHGVPPALLAVSERAIHIPMYGTNGSMNVTHALAIALFEWRRQHPN